jgi:hypothetical protein
MFVRVKVRQDISDKRNYVISWSIKMFRLGDKLPENEYEFLFKDVTSNFYKDTSRYYVDTDKTLRKNPHRRIR